MGIESLAAKLRLLLRRCYENFKKSPFCIIDHTKIDSFSRMKNGIFLNQRLYNRSRNFATNDSIPIILDANNGLSEQSDTLVASVAPPESHKKSVSVRKKKRLSFVL